MNKAQPAITTERRYDCMKLRQQGLTYREIGLKLNLDERTVGKHIRAAIADYQEGASETVDEMRAIERHRLDEMLKHWQPLALMGDDKAAGVVLKLMERKAKLDGLDAPTKTELTGKDGQPLATMNANINANLDLSALTDEQLAQMKTLLLAAGAEIGNADA